MMGDPRDGAAGASGREALERRVRALLDLGRPRAARDEALRGLATDPRNPALLELLGLCQIRLDDPVAARQTLEAACAEAPGRPHLHYLLGFALRETRDPAAAQARLREALRLDPDEPVYLRALAELMVEKTPGGPASAAAMAEALALARRAVAALPDAAAGHITLGYVASAGGDLAMAAEAYRAAVALDPNSATAWNNLGCVEMAAGERLSARERFREAVRLDPAAERARRNLEMLAPPARPIVIHDDFTAFLGEVLRELRDAGRLLPTVRLLALVQALGAPAVRAAIVGRAEAAGASSRIGVAAGAAVAGAALRALGPAALLPAGLAAATAGVGYLVASRKLVPLRRRYVEHVGAARREWQAARAAWIEGRLSRDARDRRIEQALETLAVALDREPIAAAAPGHPADTARDDDGGSHEKGAS